MRDHTNQPLRNPDLYPLGCPKALSKIILDELEVAYYIHDSNRNGVTTKKPRLIIHFYAAAKAILDNMFGIDAGYRLNVSESGHGDCRVVQIIPYKDKKKGVHIREDGDAFVLSTSIPYSRHYRKHPQMPMAKVQLTKSGLRLTTPPKKDWPKKATKSKRPSQEKGRHDLFNDQIEDQERYVVGDRVVTKSGGPVMHVRKVLNNNKYLCGWHSKAYKIYQEIYDGDELERAPSKKK
ncbi:hypothetical protein LCGC14_1793060 [marine sediment metagenome]|uniref:Uncharacterized protein n=1 Tax=marine sediment metagenome TaxID=412755 RepID=A0A0F9GRZ6_9ZZZZ